MRPGQKLAAFRIGDKAFEVVSPVEGVITSVNRDAIEDPSVIARDPVQYGWIAVLKSPTKWTEFAATLMVLTAVVMAFRYAVIYLDILPKNPTTTAWVAETAEA